MKMANKLYDKDINSEDGHNEVVKRNNEDNRIIAAEKISMGSILTLNDDYQLVSIKDNQSIPIGIANRDIVKGEMVLFDSYRNTEDILVVSH